MKNRYVKYVIKAGNEVMIQCQVMVQYMYQVMQAELFVTSSK